MEHAVPGAHIHTCIDSTIDTILKINIGTEIEGLLNNVH